MKNNYFIHSLRLIGVRLVFIFVSVFFVIVFTWLLNMKYGFICYSALTAFIYSTWIYNDSYYIAEKDLRAKNHVYPIKGILLALVSEIPTVVLLLLVLNSGTDTIKNLIYIIWNAPFAGFLIPFGNALHPDGIIFTYYLVPLIIPFASGIGYFAGMHHYELTDKINKLFHKEKKVDKKIS